MGETSYPPNHFRNSFIISVNIIPCILKRTMQPKSLSLGKIMDKILVEPIPSRNWKVSKERWELVYGEREKERKKSDSRVNERIYYMWFNYLRLCLDLERIGYEVPKRGGRGKIISTTKVKVSRTIYKDWDLEGLRDLRFREWYEEDKHRSLFTEGGFRFTRGTQYLH